MKGAYFVLLVFFFQCCRIRVYHLWDISWCTSTLHNDIFCHLICKILAHKHFGTFSLNYFKGSSVRNYMSFEYQKGTDFQGEKGVEYIAKIKLQLLLFWWNRQIKKNHDEFSWGILIPSNFDRLLQVAGFCTVN